jgi:hypothetical protein
MSDDTDRRVRVRPHPLSNASEEMTADKALRAFADKAKAKGLSPYVLMFFALTSANARAAYLDLTGEELPPPGADDGDDWGPFEVLSREDAARLLRRHASVAGALAADHVEDETLPAEFYSVFLLRDVLRFGAHGRDRARPLIQFTTGYDRVDRSIQSPSRLMEDPGPSVVRLSRADGSVRMVFGRTGADAAMAANLLSVLAHYPGTIEFPDEDGVPVPVPVTPELIQSLLAHVYANEPHQVAEAVTAIKKTEPAKAEWLMKLMRNKPELIGLYRAVRSELTGE